MSAVEEFLREHCHPCETCNGDGVESELSPDGDDETSFDCRDCSGTGIDPAARQALEALIAAERTALLAKLERLRGENEELRKASASARDYPDTMATLHKAGYRGPYLLPLVSAVLADLDAARVAKDSP